MSYVLPIQGWNELAACLLSKGIVYEFPPSRNDGFMYMAGNPDGPSKFHIHSIEEFGGDVMYFTHLLVKSSNWRAGKEPDLAQSALDTWPVLCAGMDSSVIAVTLALGGCFDSLGATFVAR